MKNIKIEFKTYLILDSSKIVMKFIAVVTGYEVNFANLFIDLSLHLYHKVNAHSGIVKSYIIQMRICFYEF